MTLTLTDLTCVTSPAAALLCQHSMEVPQSDEPSFSDWHNGHQHAKKSLKNKFYLYIHLVQYFFNLIEKWGQANSLVFENNYQIKDSFIPVLAASDMMAINFFPSINKFLWKLKIVCAYINLSNPIYIWRCSFVVWHLSFSFFFIYMNTLWAIPVINVIFPFGRGVGGLKELVISSFLVEMVSEIFPLDWLGSTKRWHH